MKIIPKHGESPAERGSVLMETILAIPLFIAFFSGIFVLGDLMLGRNRLTAADRFAVWLTGSRLADQDDDQAKQSASEAPRERKCSIWGTVSSTVTVVF